jgi:hypothetical protein
MIHQSGTGFLDIADCSPTVLAYPSEVIRIDTDTALNRVDARNFDPHSVTLPSSATLGLYRTPRQTANASATFATPGDVSVSYGNRTAYWAVDGNWIDFELTFAFTPTFTTASGNLIITVSGINPLSSVARDVPVGIFTGLNLASTRETLAMRRNADGTFTLASGGDALGAALVTAAECTSATQITLNISGRFMIRV